MSDYRAVDQLSGNIAREPAVPEPENCELQVRVDELRAELDGYKQLADQHAENMALGKSAGQPR